MWQAQCRICVMDIAIFLCQSFLAKYTNLHSPTLELLNLHATALKISCCFRIAGYLASTLAPDKADFQFDGGLRVPEVMWRELYKYQKTGEIVKLSRINFWMFILLKYSSLFNHTNQNCYNIPFIHF